MYRFLEDSNLFFKLQFGFRQNTSTNHALVNIINEIQSKLDKGQLSCGVFVDLQKAFDTVDHKILLKKLEHYGVRGITLKWFISYLKNRNQFVYVNGFSSKSSVIKHGVPQGSILGPLLFIIYINDLHKAIPNSTVHHFADDTNFLLSDTSLKKLTLKINQDMTCLSKWLRSNKLALNVSKTELIVFKRPSRILNFKYHFKIDGHKIKPKSTIKYLGLTLDEHITWKPYLDQLTCKLNRKIGIISKLRHFNPLSFLKNVYYAFFDSLLNYGCQVWGVSNQSIIDKIQKLQNRALRKITFTARQTSISPVYKQLEILKFEDMIHLRNILFMHQLENNMLPKVFNNFST